MLDLFHVPGNDGVSTQDVFYGQAQSANDPIPWYKPRGASMCHIFMVGAGGGGGSGFIGASGAAGGGSGGGGGSQTITIYLDSKQIARAVVKHFPAILKVKGVAA